LRRGRDRPTAPRLTRWEIVGAWTHLWTPPKGIPVPPVPWRKLAVAAAAGLVLAAIAAALIVPPLEHGKRRGAARDARRQAAIVAAAVVHLRADQRLHRASPPAGATPLVRALERSITADARRRVSAGTLGGPVLGTTCEAAGKAVTIRPGTRVYTCVAATSVRTRAQGPYSITSGYPFVATIDFRGRTLAWCKTNPRPGEQTGGHGIAHVKLSRECAGRLAELI
jgi:hypothetical protein